MKWNPYAHEVDAVPQAPRTALPDDDEPYRGVERAVRDALHRRGWQVTKRGWPDFFCLDEQGRMVAVEVKGPGDRVSRYQARCMEALARHGILVRIAVIDRAGHVTLYPFAAAEWFDRRRAKARRRKRAARAALG
jgi:hypothetical protein